MPKSPHTPEFRAKVSQECLDGSSYPFLVRKYNIGQTTLQQWVAKYRLYGIAAFIKAPGNSSYSSDFKKMCVDAVLSRGGSVDDIVARVGHCIDNGPTEGVWGIIKSEMYQMYEITDEASLKHAIKDYIRFYRENKYSIFLCTNAKTCGILGEMHPCLIFQMRFF